MAWEQKIGSIGALVANASMASNQYKCVKVSADNQFSLCDTDGEVLLGVLQDKPDSGMAGEVMVLGVTKVMAAEALVAGDYWGTTTLGKATKVEKTYTGADLGDYVAGQVLVGAATGELATVTVGFPTFIVEHA
jgi:hypothetical protein